MPELSHRTPEQERDSLARRLGVRYEEGAALKRRVEVLESVLEDRERELLELKGPCSSKHCRLHYAHSGPCDIKAEDNAARGG